MGTGSGACHRRRRHCTCAGCGRKDTSHRSRTMHRCNRAHICIPRCCCTSPSPCMGAGCALDRTPHGLHSPGHQSLPCRHRRHSHRRLAQRTPSSHMSGSAAQWRPRLGTRRANWWRGALFTVAAPGKSEHSNRSFTAAQQQSLNTPSHDSLSPYYHRRYSTMWTREG